VSMVRHRALVLKGGRALFSLPDEREGRRRESGEDYDGTKEDTDR
jgi:hypothetical protein